MAQTKETGSQSRVSGGIVVAWVEGKTWGGSVFIVLPVFMSHPESSLWRHTFDFILE